MILVALIAVAVAVWALLCWIVQHDSELVVVGLSNVHDTLLVARRDTVSEVSCTRVAALRVGDRIKIAA